MGTFVYSFNLPFICMSIHAFFHSFIPPPIIHPSIYPFIFCHLSADDPVICQSIQSGSIERAQRQLVAPDKSRLLISWHYAALSQQISAGSSTLVYLTLISKQHAEITRHCVGVKSSRKFLLHYNKVKLKHT